MTTGKEVWAFECDGAPWFWIFGLLGDGWGLQLTIGYQCVVLVGPVGPFLGKIWVWTVNWLVVSGLVAMPIGLTVKAFGIPFCFWREEFYYFLLIFVNLDEKKY